ncbi:tungstate transport system ATP-binding protein [Desulfonatronum thiosulfatophilum]|uniref:Tungstate transport system ATP-binding protein n=1 Tax=Desulfonatronum thiosulfatophilum TaxID=617002 RepID=A0A1G6D821_9BACT|nr:ATP-binding cassette domain-containing protein [Desulfonatronum thiosulfatophilum]SDB41209.1 tungstate transport system ATP-binding protein [Desulfonatronum thiosulfatophilum]
MSLYSLQEVRQVFEDRTVLDIDNLEMTAGGSYALLGPNGSGKTTLLHVLAFLRPPSSGVIYFQGQKVEWRDSVLTGLRRKVVLVDQHPIMFSTTVLKNVEYGPRMRGVSARERRKAAEECLERVGMSAFAHRPAHLLSGGETQRVAIARAMACRPEVMLFDEPTASVDVENQAVIDGVIRQLRKDKGVNGRISIIFSTHKPLEASRLAQERIFLFEGRLTGPGGENLLSCDIVQGGGGAVCVVGDNVALPVQTSRSGPGRVFIKPELIGLFPLDAAHEETTEQGHVGEILQMTAEGPNIKVLLDIGVPLRTLLSKDEARHLDAMVGEKVRVRIDPEAIELA